MPAHLLERSHSLSIESCMSALGSGPDGLSTAEAGRRLQEFGPNQLPEAQGRGPFRRFLEQYNSVLVFVLLGAALVTACLQHWIDTGVILAVVFGNAFIGYLQEGQAEAAMAVIQGMPVVWAVVIMIKGAQIAITYLPPLQAFFGTQAVPSWDGVLWS